MSDIFESAALIFSLPDGEAQTYALDLHRRVAALGQLDEETIGLKLIPDIPAEFQKPEILQGWPFTVEAVGERGLYIAAQDETCDFQHALGAFIQHLLKRWDPTGFVQFEWSRVCSHPEPTCFSGGGAHITAEQVQLFSTLDWIEERAKAEEETRQNRTGDDNDYFFGRVNG